MILRIRDAAALLGVSERTIDDWIVNRQLPAHCINGQYCFNRGELLEWATSVRLSISPTILEQTVDECPSALAEALRCGGIHHDVAATDRGSALGQAVAFLPLPDDIDREFVLEVLLARESIGSTAVGNGVAIPHVRNPVTFHVQQPTVLLCFLRQGIDFGAIDGQPVHTLFTIVSPTIKSHLSLLSRLAYGLRVPAFATAIAERAAPERILRAAADLDNLIDARPAPGRNRV